WGQHALIGLRNGLTPEEIDRVPAGPSANRWPDPDALLLRAADELHELYTLSDGTWALLAERYDEPQLIELVMLVGHYHLVAMTLNALGVEPDEGIPGFPEAG
ncbi:MAG: carboxymuconolactone decarboxylase family protein, partial [Acidimicrobiales bacterium]